MEVLVEKDPQDYARDTVFKSIKLTVKKDENTVMFRCTVEDLPDNIDTWFGVLRFFDTAGAKQLDDLLDDIPELLAATVTNDSHNTYVNLLHALLKWLSVEKDFEDRTQKWHVPYNELEQALFRFTVSDPNRGFFTAVFLCNSEEKLKVLLPYAEFKDNPIPICRVTMARAYLERKDDALYFIDHYKYFQRNIARLVQNTDIAKRCVGTFLNLSKALVILIKQGLEDLAIYEPLISEICTFIIKRETNIEEQKRYLEYILESRENEDEKKQRLDEIIGDCGSRPDINKIQFMQVIGIISDHYLRRYDFEKSDYFWKKAGNNHRVLNMLLNFHKYSLSYLFVLFVLLISLFLFIGPHSFFHWALPSFLDQNWLLTGFSWLPPALIFFLIGSVVLSAALKTRHWLYSQLLFPRLVGAAIVGMFPLLFSSQSWLVGLQSNFVPWLLLFLITYVSSFAYMFIEVYKTMKFVQGSTLQEALRTSLKIFCIAACETLVIVTVTSMFVFPSISQSLFNQKGITDLNNNVPNLSVSIFPWLSFNLFPSLILLWGGFALFIGSFVQLLWQDKRITDGI